MTGRYIQQDDVYRRFFQNMMEGGLMYCYQKFTKNEKANDFYRKPVSEDKKKSIIIVGAGLAGLVAAYELSQAGHKVTILEAQSRAGGEARTMREHFSDGLYDEAGPMRIPTCHYLVRHYVDMFGITPKPFYNFNREAYIYMNGEKVKMGDWHDRNEYYSSRWWPGWDKNLTQETKKNLKINGLLDYFARTVDEMKREFGENPAMEEWLRWTEKYVQMSADEFFRSDDGRTKHENKLRPWPEEAIKAYSMIDSRVYESISLIHWRRHLGGFSEDPMYTLLGGIDALPNEFLKTNSHGWNSQVHLAKDITFGFCVDSVTETKDSILVSGKNTTTHKRMSYSGDAAIITLPLHLLRNLKMDFTHSDKKKAVLENLTHACALKSFFQCKTKFWEKDVGQGGGFSRTDLPIRDIYYPWSEVSSTQDTERGILMTYTDESASKIFRAMPSSKAIAEAVKQLSFIHPEIEEHFETGVMVDWHTQPFAECCFNTCSPNSYLQDMKTLMIPSPRVYMAGQALSWTTSWVQGAFFSGLMQAFCFIYYNESGECFDPIMSFTNIKS